MGKTKRPLRVVFLADMHVGHRVGLAIPDETPDSDYGYPVRKALYDIWRECVSSEWRRPDALVANGDLVDGQGGKRAGVEQWTTDLYEQALMAVELLKMWKAKRYYVLRGSKYHVEPHGTGLPIEEYLAEKLGAEEYPNQDHIKPERRMRSGTHWYLTFGGVTFHVQHHIAVSRVFHYRTTPNAREMLHMKLNDALRHETGKYKTTVTVRAHAHYFNHVEFTTTHGFILPCWQALSPFMESRGALAISPDVGFLGVEVLSRGRFRYEKFLWRLEDAQRPPHTIVGQ